MSNKDLYTEITEKIMGMLSQGIIPWKKPWSTNGCDMPQNFISKKFYRGVNVWLLCSAYKSNFWLTYNQAKKIGGNIKAGEKGTRIYFRQILVSSKDKNGKQLVDSNGNKTTKSFPMLKTFTVFNVEQCENIKLPEIKVIESTPKEKISKCENVVNSFSSMPEIMQSNRASYVPSMDVINMPKMDDFVNSESYYATLFHEIVHSTGSKNRLNRDLDTNFGSHAYSKEELVAELGSSFLNFQCGIDNVTMENSVAYIQNWMQVLKNDIKFFMNASSLAQKAVDYILGTKFEESTED